MRIQSLPPLLAALLLAPACGASGSYSDGVYRGSDTAYSLGDLGSGWERISVARENDLAFRNVHLGAIVQVNASCDPSLDIPHEALTNHLLVGFREREEIEPARWAPMDGREGLRTHIRAKLDGVTRELVLYVLLKDGCVYDFALVSPPGRDFEAALPDYEALVSGFRTLERRP